MEKRLDRISATDYLEQESRGAIRHEYLDGETFPLSAASQRHKLIVSNLIRKAQAAVVPTGPRVYGPHIRVHVRDRNCFYYPDLCATAEPNDRDQQFVSRPCLVVEVLSSSTAVVDRREKRMNYASILSLKEYVTVDQERMRVNVFPRGDGDVMVKTFSDPDDVVEFACLGTQVNLREIYRGVDFGNADGE
jgi:Uma2 family endonuclease